MKTPKVSRSLFPMLLCGSALLLSGQALAAPQGPELYFYPAGKWSLDKQGQNCSAQTAFNNGFILNFKGGESWIETLSINFRQNIFKSGEAYSVVLTAPGVQSQTLKATAPTAETLAINLLGRKELFKAIKTGSVLDTSIEGNDFRFYLTGFTPIADEFEKCMAGGVLEAKAVSPEQQQAYMTNEAIAMEETAKAEAATPVPAPVVSEIPYTETQKIGGEVIDPAASIETQTQEIGAAKIKGDPVPTETTIVANDPVTDQSETAESLTELAPVSEEPVMENAPEPTQAQLKPASSDTRPRMSDQIAQQIQDNPEIADVPPEKLMTADTAPVIASSEKPILVEDEPQSGGLSMPPDMNRAALIPTTADAKTIDYSALARAQLAGEALPIATATIPADADSKTSIDESSSEIQADPPPPLNATEASVADINETSAPVEKEEVLFDGPRVDVTTLSTQPPATPPVSVSDGETLAQNSISTEVDTTDIEEPQKVLEPEAQVEDMAAITPEPKTETGASPEAEPGPAPEPVTQNYKTPEQIETKESYTTSADFRQSGLSAETDTASMARMAELESKVSKLMAENTALNKELDNAISASEDERLSISSDNWNLEQATMRFNEAERQMKKLGMELQKERAQCEAEKKDLEATLFDPQITSQEQMARLGSLEDQLRDAKAQLEAQRIQYETRIKELGGSI